MMNVAMRALAGGRGRIWGVGERVAIEEIGAVRNPLNAYGPLGDFMDVACQCGI
jgi:hypothetical protein